MNDHGLKVVSDNNRRDWYFQDIGGRRMGPYVTQDAAYLAMEQYLKGWGRKA